MYNKVYCTAVVVVINYIYTNCVLLLFNLAFEGNFETLLKNVTDLIQESGLSGMKHWNVTEHQTKSNRKLSMQKNRPMFSEILCVHLKFWPSTLSSLTHDKR